MAEVGHSQSLRDSSDADFEISCTPCGEDDIREEAVKYCPECQEYLCSSCFRHHSRQKATRSHKLLDKDEAKTGSVLAKAKCRYHPDRDIEMFCGTHDMVYCTTCIATEHRSCGGVTRIEEKSKSFVQPTEIQRLTDDTKRVQERMRAFAIKKQKNIGSLEKQRIAVQERIAEVATNLIQHIKQLEAELSESLANGYSRMKRELESEVSVATHMIQNLDSTSKLLQTISSMDPAEQFVHMKLMERTVSEANKLHANCESDGTKSVKFIENTDLIISVTTATALGQIHTDKKTAGPVQYKMKSKKEVNVKVDNDKNTCTISDVCQLPDGMILLTDQGNNKVKRLDVNYRLKDYCCLDACPTGICYINNNEIAVKMGNNNIQFITVASSLFIKKRQISIEYGYLWGITYYDGGLWTSKSGGVNIYNTTGTLIKSVDKDQDGKVIFKTNSIQHMDVSGDTVIITDYSDGAVRLNKEGKVQGEFRDSRLKTTCGVCVSEDRTVFLSGCSSNNIVMFSRDGKCLGEVVASDAGLKSIINMCYDKNKHCLIVACQNSNEIHVVVLGE